MTEYAYKVTMTNEDCHGKRFVAFHDERWLDFWQAGKEAIRHMFSQNCTKCGKAHLDDEYFATEVERGETDANGCGVSYRIVRPDDGGSSQQEFSYA